MNRLVKASLRPVRNITATLLANTVICAALFEIFEEGDHGPLGAFYWAVTTATTTGYGDLSPATLPGRIVGMWLMISSLMLFAVVIGQITSALVQDPHMFSHEEQEELKDDTDDILTVAVLIAHELGVKIPDSVEEANDIINERNAHGGKPSPTQ